MDGRLRSDGWLLPPTQSGVASTLSVALEPWGIVKLGAWTVATAADSSASWKRPALVRGMISFFLALPAEPSLGFFNFLALRLRNKLYQLIVSGEPVSHQRSLVLCSFGGNSLL